MATARQIAANQRNARASTGPTSDAGKEVSRRNALKHGRAGAGVVLTDGEAAKVERRVAEWNETLRPEGAMGAYLVAQLAAESVRIERCQHDERVLLLCRAARAEAGWDEDRRLAAEEVGARLGNDPARTVRRLRQSAQGCDWLLERWGGLARAVEGGQPWDEAQRSMALDLLGVPPALRGEAAAGGAVPNDPEAQRALAAARVDELGRLKDEVMDDRDAIEREAAVEGCGAGDATTERELRLTRRYESACQRRFDRALRLLLGGRLSTPSSTVPAPCPAAPAPSPAPVAPAPAPPVVRPASAEAHPRPTPTPTPAPAPAPAPAAAPAAPGAPAAPTADDPPKGNRRWRKQQRRRDRRAA